MTRYAIYAAPERETRLWHFGNRVLGRDAETGADIAQIVPDGFALQDWRRFTASPCRYGFHATLKAPFHLADGVTEKELLDAARSFAAARAPIENIALKPVASDAYVMLALERDDRRVHDLAEACVSAFDDFRAPLTDAERAKRGPGLTARQKEHLERWGYPYVFGDFTFHLTLAGPLPQNRGNDVLAALADGYRQAVKDEPLAIRSLCVFSESAGAPFRLVLRTPLGGP